jgi:hypothetical protein
MQSVSPELAAAVAETVRWPYCKLEVAWDGTNYVDESAYVLSADGKLRLNEPGDELVKPGEIGTANVTLKNVGGRFSWGDSRSALYANISGALGLAGKKVKLSVGFELPDTSIEYVRIFTGVIYGWGESPAARTVTLILRDRGYTWLQDKRSSTISTDQRADEWIASLATLAGIAGGDQVLDAGIGTIPYCWMDDESLVDEIWQAAQADGGVAYFDQLGKLHFENSVHWLIAEHLAVSWTFGADDFDNVDPELSPDDVASTVTVEWSPRIEGAQEVLYTLDGLKVIKPGEHLDWEARFSHPAMSTIAPVNTETSKDYFIVSAGGHDLTDDIVVALSDVYAQKCTVTVTNNSAQTAQVTLLQIRGYPLLGGPTEQIKVDVAPAPGLTRERQVRGNPYVQTFNQGNALCNRLAVVARRIRPRHTLRGVRGVPQLELGDRISFANDRQIYPSNVEGPLVGIGWRFSPSNGFEQDLTALDDTDLYEYLDFFIIGTTAVGVHGRCWY